MEQPGRVGVLFSSPLLSSLLFSSLLLSVQQRDLRAAAAAAAWNKTAKGGRR